MCFHIFIFCKKIVSAEAQNTPASKQTEVSFSSCIRKKFDSYWFAGYKPGEEISVADFFEY